MKELTKEQAVVISAFTGVVCCKFEHLHEYTERKFGREVWTHEFANEEFAKELKELSKKDFAEVCYNG